MDASFTHAHLDEALDQAGLSAGASELHGLLTGYMCGGGRAEGRHMLAALQLEPDDAAAAAPLVDLLNQAGPRYREQLDDPQLGFEALLPPDSRPLAERADAVVEWTRGFLGGFGLADARADALTDDGREVLRDLGSIASSQLALDTSSDSAAEEDESALMELVEFVRVGAMLLRTEVAAAEPSDNQAS
ncbi:MAG TPA: UPF0149 family protein [Oleiagrimonas sp.]|nr:UPF0149 family protein [Oleiagrimonas sp.]